MKWSSTLEHADGAVEPALRRAAERLGEELGGEADLLLAFVATGDVADYDRVPAVLGEVFPDATLAGCSAAGVVGGGREAESGPCISLTGAVLPHVHASVFHLPSGGPRDSAALRAAIEVGGADDPCLLVFPEPASGDVEPLLRGLDDAWPRGTVLGGLPSSLDPVGGGALFVGQTLHAEGVGGVALSGGLSVRTLVAQGCRPVGQPRFVTRSEGNLIQELDGRPAHKVLEEMLGGLSDRDRDLARQNLFIGIAMRESTRIHTTGDFLIRNVLGYEARTRALAVAATLPDRATVQFQLRDATTSRQDLEALLAQEVEDLDGARPEGVLLFSCLGRGRRLYGVQDHDPGLFRQHLGDAPMGGFFCNGEIGPVQGHTHLHGYTSAFGLFFSC